MNRIMMAGLIVVASFAFFSPCFAQPSQTEKEIRELEDKMNAAYAANDLPTYLGF